MRLNRLVFAFILFIQATASAMFGTAAAHTATRFFTIQEDLPAEGAAAEVAGVLYLTNLFKDREFIVVARSRDNAGVGVRDQRGLRGEGWTSDKVRIGGGVSKLPFRAALVGDGKHILAIDIQVFNASGLSLGVQTHQLYFRVSGGVYKRATYAELYVPAGFKTPGPKGVRIIGVTAKPIGAEPVVPFGPARGGLTFDDRRLKLMSLPEKGQGSGSGAPPRMREPFDRQIKGQTPAAPAQPQVPVTPGSPGSVQPATPPGQTSYLDGAMERLARVVTTALGAGPAYAQGTYAISGTFSYRGVDNALHPGWNWFVEVWWQRGANDWVRLAQKFINWDGTWSVSASAPGFSGQNIHVNYRAGGYYLMPRDRNDNPYWWSDPTWSSISTNYNVGHRVADVSASGTLAGLGEAYNAGIIYWNKFYSSNINPERANPIRMYFPNDYFDCNNLTWTDTDPDPWSCAWEDRIWIIPAHANNSVVQHELSHQLMNQYWNNQQPAGAGGSHALDQCYNTGLGLSEGFANAAPVWVLSGENAVNPQPTGFAIETPASSVCSGDTNETRVAATLWDLLDRHGDGTDVLWFNNPAEVFSIILGNGKKDGIKEFRSIYRNAASPGHQQYIDDIYTNNTITVP